MERPATTRFRTILFGAIVPFLFLFTSTVLILAFDLDRYVCDLCYQDGRWIGGEAGSVCKTLYDVGEIPGLILGIGGCVVGTVSLLWKRWKPYRNPAFFLAASLALGPGLLVNAILKPNWSRPRPVHVEEFGGSTKFVGVFGFAAEGNYKSFPCGHASVAFYMIAPAFLLYRTRFRLAAATFAFGLAFGCSVGVARIMQGGHFLSDVVWAGGMVYITCLLTAILFGFVGRAEKPSSAEQEEEATILNLETYRQKQPSTAAANDQRHAA